MKARKTMIIISTLIVVLSINSCVSIPKGATAVSSFDKEKYLGIWYEIARMDFRFERNLNNTTATYSVNADGSIKVYNRGYNYKSNKWSDVTGKAKFVDSPTVARLKVSFFGPFYSGYNVIALDKDYKYALVAGNNLSYLWILCREKTIPDNVKQNYLKIAEELGFNTSALIWVQHDK